MFQWFWTIFSLGAPGKWLLRMAVEAEGTQESDNDTENDSQETATSSPETSTAFHSKSSYEH